MPEGEITFATEARDSVSDMGQGEFHDFSIEVDDIRLGENVLYFLGPC